MVKNHLKRLAIPKSWRLKKKESVFAIRPLSGSHSVELSMPLGILLRDVLKYADTLKEVKLILNHEKILLNKKEVKNYKYPVGLFDILEIEKTKDKFIVLINQVGKLVLKPYDKDVTFLKVRSKNIVKGNKYMLGFLNGFTSLVDKKIFDSTKVGDSIIFDLYKKKIKDVINFKEGSFTYVFKGKYVGYIGKILSITKGNGLSKDVIEIENKKDEENSKIITSTDNCYVIGKKETDLKLFK